MQDSEGGERKISSSLFRFAFYETFYSMNKGLNNNRVHNVTECKWLLLDYMSVANYVKCFSMLGPGKVISGYQYTLVCHTALCVHFYSTPAYTKQTKVSSRVVGLSSL